MKIVVTGAGGMLGNDVVLLAEDMRHQVVALTRDDLDVTDPARVERLITRERPGAVINCAAWTDVDGAEAQPDAAAAVNAAGAGHVAEAAGAAGARLVHVSTDYVFDGASPTPYIESAATHPLSVYGRTKLEGERAVGQAGDEHVIVRSSWLFGTGGHNFVETMLRLGGERDSVAVVTDQVGCPTWTAHLAAALVDLAGSRQRGLLHVAGAGSCSWNQFAAEIFARAGVRCKVEPATTADMARPAPRPANSVLRSERGAPELPPWQEGLAGYLAARAQRSAPTAKALP